MVDAIGWTASAILLITLIRQIYKQVKEPEAGGVSTWLFIGQATASALFTLYSILLENWVYIITNGCLLATALIGQWLTRRRASVPASASPQDQRGHR